MLSWCLSFCYHGYHRQGGHSILIHCGIYPKRRNMRVVVSSYSLNVMLLVPFPFYDHFVKARISPMIPLYVCYLWLFLIILEHLNIGWSKCWIWIEMRGFAMTCSLPQYLFFNWHHYWSAFVFIPMQNTHSNLICSAIRWSFTQPCQTILLHVGYFIC